VHAAGTEANHHSAVMQWRACAARGSVLGAEDDNDLRDSAQLALGDASMEGETGLLTHAAFTSEQSVRVTL
jgi:hypothetical protein